MTTSKPKRTIYDDDVETELARWPGVTWRRAHRSKHLALILGFNGSERLVTYSGTPSDSRRGVLLHLADVKMALKDMGAVRTPQPRAAGPRRTRNRTTAPMRIEDRCLGGPKRDPWAALQGVEGVLATDLAPGPVEGAPAPRLIETYAGRDVMHEHGWVLAVMLVTRRDLMTRARDVGRVVLAGLSIEVFVRKGHSWRSKVGDLPKWRVRFAVRSDAREIVERIAEGAGVVA